MYNPYFFYEGGLSEKRIRNSRKKNELGIVIIEKFPILL